MFLISQKLSWEKHALKFIPYHPSFCIQDSSFRNGKRRNWNKDSTLRSRKRQSYEFRSNWVHIFWVFFRISFFHRKAVQDRDDRTSRPQNKRQGKFSIRTNWILQHFFFVSWTEKTKALKTNRRSEFKLEIIIFPFPSCSSHSSLQGTCCRWNSSTPENEKKMKNINFN